jgi:hypothetical protein
MGQQKFYECVKNGHNIKAASLTLRPDIITYQENEMIINTKGVMGQGKNRKAKQYDIN